MKKTHYFLFLLAFTVSCSGNPAAKKVKTTCGPLKTFTVDAAYSEKMGLPEAAFTVSYPGGMETDPAEPGYQNYAYNYFMKYNAEDIQTEAISLGYSTVRRNSPMKDNLSTSLMQQARGMLVQMGFKLSDVFIGRKNFDGKSYFMLRANAQADNKELEFVGNYLVQAVIVEPESDDNGLFLLMFANEESDIKSFGDFAKKGCVSSVWNSLVFNY